jgi:hypothetical protein
MIALLYFLRSAYRRPLPTAMNIDQPVKQTPHKITKVTAKRRLKFFSFSIVLSLFSLLYIRPSLFDGAIFVTGTRMQEACQTR